MRFHAFAVCLVIAVLTVATPSDARAQGCDCPEAQMLEVMDFRIAERRAKLDFVQAGGRESSSGLSNDRSVLAQELREMRRTREILVRDLISCRMQCYSRNSSLFDDGTANTGATSRCASCNTALNRLSAAEDALSFAQGNFTRFHQAHEFDRYSDADPANYGRRVRILREAEQDMEAASAMWAELRDAQLEACARADIHTPGTAPSDSFEYGPGWEEEDRYFYPDELWADTDGEEYRAARDRVLAERRQNLDIHLWTLEDVLEHYEISSETWDNRVNETTRSLMQESEDEFGRTVPAMTDREEAWELAFHMEHTSLRRRLSLDHNRDPDSYWGLGDDLARIWEYGRVRAYYDDRSEGSVTGALLSPLDEALDYLRSIGLDPGAIDVTVYGECLRHSHALDVFLRETYYPTRGALGAARAQVPGDGGAVWEDYQALARTVRNAIAERDDALANLVRCNANYCRPEPTNITEFVDEGDGEDLETLLDEGEDAPYGGPDDGLEGDGPDLTPAPLSDPEAPTETGMIEIPGMDEMRERFDAENAAALAARDRMNATGMLRTPRFACDFQPGNVCDKLEGRRASRCISEMQSWLAACQRSEAMASSPGAAQCSARCVHQGETAEMALILRDLALEVVAESDRNASAISEGQRAELEPRITATQAEIDTLEAEIAAARIHIYTNRDTGEIVQHNGPYFEPNPPLEYTGEMAAPPTDAQSERRYVLTARLQSLQEALDDVNAASPDPAALDDWRQLARYTWLGGEYNGLRSNGAITCEAEQIAPEVARCQAFCAAQDIDAPGAPPPHPLDICQPTSTHGMLNTPLSRTWLYPPGDPRREPGHGRSN